jgi:protoporphyrinogen oxidase/SAM-dependent methyltransferase
MPLPQTRIAIVGGGPGGLFTAWLLADKLNGRCQIVLYEATDRLGGKISTRRFDPYGPLYEAGTAELYDYSMIGQDPLHQFIRKLGLSTIPMNGGSVVLNGSLLRTKADIRQLCGRVTADAIDAFRREAAAQMTPRHYCAGRWEDDNRHPWAAKSYRAILDAIPDQTARRYIEVLVHSDIATEPHLTNGLNGLKNFLMNLKQYVRLYTITGGIERLVDALGEKLPAQLWLQRRVVSVEKQEGGYFLSTRANRELRRESFDIVVIALPYDALAGLDWGNGKLAKAIGDHVARYDRPGHYLRISILFAQPFWREYVQGDYFIVDAFGGACVYDESARYGDVDGHAVLGWLLAGDAAFSKSNLNDVALITEALDSLPRQFQAGRDVVLEGRVHRWLTSVNGLPGGFPTLDLTKRHRPEPEEHPGVIIVGDYLFDSTLNGVLDSAHVATDLIVTELNRRTALSYLPRLRTGSAASTKAGRDHKAHLTGRDNRRSGNVSKAYHDFYDGERPYEESFNEYFDAQYTVDLLRIIWDRTPPFTLLDCGSGSGLTLAEFAKVGVDAWGVENSVYAHSRTIPQWRRRNILGDVCAMPFLADQFDFLYDTCLCYVQPKDVDGAIREMSRVCRTGIFFGAITSDMTREVIQKHDLFYEVRTLHTLREWSEKFLKNGWRLADVDAEQLARAWKRETDANEGDCPWYESKETMRYCFYTKVRGQK